VATLNEISKSIEYTAVGTVTDCCCTDCEKEFTHDDISTVRIDNDEQGLQMIYQTV